MRARQDGPVNPALVVAVLAVAVGLAVAAGIVAALGHAPPRRLLQGLLALQLVLLAQLVVVGYRLAQGTRPQEVGAFVGYLVLSLLLLPGGLALSVDERSRYGTLVLGVACVTVAVVELRMVATWS